MSKICSANFRKAGSVCICGQKDMFQLRSWPASNFYNTPKNCLTIEYFLFKFYVGVFGDKLFLYVNCGTDFLDNKNSKEAIRSFLFLNNF
jgi:hypothetical protein